MTPLSGGDVYSIWARYVRPEHAGWTWRMLHGLYDGLGRHYHRLDHVCACLAELEALVNPGACDVEVAALALIWHDAVYVPGDPDNEQLSGQLLMAVSRTRLGSVNIGVFERAYNAILVTQHHDGEAMGDHTIAAVVDIDLSILGCTEPRLLELRGEGAARVRARERRGMAPRSRRVPRRHARQEQTDLHARFDVREVRGEGAREHE